MTPMHHCVFCYKSVSVPRRQPFDLNNAHLFEGTTYKGHPVIAPTNGYAGTRYAVHAPAQNVLQGGAIIRVTRLPSRLQNCDERQGELA